jgi:hypothetical protein
MVQRKLWVIVLTFATIFLFASCGLLGNKSPLIGKWQGNDQTVGSYTWEFLNNGNLMVTVEGYIAGGTWRTIDNDHIEITINTPTLGFLDQSGRKAILEESFSEDKTGLILTGLGEPVTLYKKTSTNSQHMPTPISQGETPPPTSIPPPIYQGTLAYQATLEVKGDVYAYGTGSAGNLTVTSVSFTLTNAENGQAVDLTPNTGNSTAVTVISYTDQNQHVSELPWTVQWIGKNNGNNLLEQDEQAVVTVYFSGLTTAPGTYSTFTIEVKPVTGASLIINRTLPASIAPVMALN